MSVGAALTATALRIERAAHRHNGGRLFRHGGSTKGSDDGAIGERLELSRNTVRNHVAALYRKTGVNSRAKLVIWARERGFVGAAS